MSPSKQTFIEFPLSARYYSRSRGIWGIKFWGGVRVWHGPRTNSNMIQWDKYTNKGTALCWGPEKASVTALQGQLQRGTLLSQPSYQLCGSKKTTWIHQRSLENGRANPSRWPGSVEGTEKSVKARVQSQGPREVGPRCPQRGARPRQDRHRERGKGHRWGLASWAEPGAVAGRPTSSNSAGSQIPGLRICGAPYRQWLSFQARKWQSHVRFPKRLQKGKKTHRSNREGKK